MSKNKQSKLINDFTDYRLTGDLRITPEATAIQVACYKRLFEPLGVENTILDDACRDGRIAIPLSQYYKKVTGVEVNHKLVESARKQSINHKNLVFFEEDVRKLSFLDNSFDGVLSAFSSWGVYGKEGDLQSLKEMVRVLKPGGALVIDWGNAEARLREINTRGVYNFNLGHKVIYELFETPKGEAVVRTSWLDKSQGYHWICQKVGFMDPLIVGLQPAYLPSIIKDMMHDAGLEITATYGNYNLEPVNDRNNRLIIKAIKSQLKRN